MNQELTILEKLAEKPPVKELIDYGEAPCERSAAHLAAAVYECGWQKNFLSALKDAIVKDVNPFSVAAAKGESDKYLEAAFDSDVNALFSLAAAAKSNAFNYGDAEKPSAKELKTFYRTHGYGEFIFNKAFYYKDGEILPVTNAPDTRLCDLKDYEEEKQAIKNNIENFLGGLPYSDMLLYGERGTGKSSTVHAMLNEYFDQGLRIAEIGKEDVARLPELKKALSSLPLKFIIYIDDLSLTETDGSFTALKAALEGSFIGRADNTMVAATSNRRHIVKENFSDRNDSVHAGDAVQEQLSLSDRFGLSVLFSTTTKQQYLSIFRQLAEDFGLKTDIGTLENLAERWAILKGGRSPRRARQFAEFVYSCEKRGNNIEF